MVLSLVNWSVAVDALAPSTTLLGRAQAGVLPEVGLGAIVQLSTAVPAKPWIGDRVRTSVAPCPGAVIESVLLAAAIVKLGPTVTSIGICTDWIC